MGSRGTLLLDAWRRLATSLGARADWTSRTGDRARPFRNAGVFAARPSTSSRAPNVTVLPIPEWHCPRSVFSARPVSLRFERSGCVR